MGLDMYLYRHTYIGNKWKKPEEQFCIAVPTIRQERVVYIIEEVAYWRKVNAIHRWFVTNIQNGVDDCGNYYVDPKKLTELIDMAKKVLADHSQASSLLPTQSGFFFGPTEYDDRYFKDLEDTVTQLTFVLPDPSDASDFYYHSSW